MKRILSSKRESMIAIFMLTFSFLLLQCSESKRPTYIAIQPDYSQLQLNLSADTIKFSWDSSFYNYIKSFNYFIDEGTGYIAFFDKQSITVNIYRFNSQQLVKKIRLEECLPGRKLHKNTSVFVKNMDSVYVSTSFIIFRLNKIGRLVDSVLLQKSPYYAISRFGNVFPPVFSGGRLYLMADPILPRYEAKSLNKWKVLYTINTKTGETALTYPLPDIFRQAKYAEDFYDNNYCYNDKGRFVFSFSLSTEIFESDLKDLHHSYFARSRYQQSEISPIIGDPLKRSQKRVIEKNTLLSDIYGPIYFDPYRKRYLRVAKQKISEEAYYTKDWNRRQSILLFNENFKLTGESEISSGIDPYSIFFTKDGEVYARQIRKDDFAAYFIKLEYNDLHSTHTAGQIK